MDGGQRTSGSYFIAKTLSCEFDEAIARVRSALEREGFGVLTDIDIKETLHKKLGVDFRKYRILGACNPPFAYCALQAEDKIGTLLPCNVVVQETADGEIEVAAVDPVASMQAIGNRAFNKIAQDVRARLLTVIDRL